MAWNVNKIKKNVIDEGKKSVGVRDLEKTLKQELDKINFENNYKAWNEEARKKQEEIYQKHLTEQQEEKRKEEETELLEEYPFLYQVIESKKKERNVKRVKKEHINYAKRKMLVTAIAICLYERPELEEEQEWRR